jgi:HEAT repeat protein
MKPSKERAAAAQRLKALELASPGAKALPDLLKAIKGEPDPETRITIINSAIPLLLRSKAAYPVELIDALFDANPGVRSLAATYAGSAGEPGLFGPAPPEAMPLLLKALRSQDADVRSSAVGAISHMNAEPKSVLPYLTKALQDDSMMVRNNAAVEVWRMTKRADLVFPTWAALAGSVERLMDPIEGTGRDLIQYGLSTLIEDRVREKPDEVCAELLRAVRSPAADVRFGAARLLLRFLEAKDRTLDAKRKEVREELARLAKGPNEQVRDIASHVLAGAEELRKWPQPAQLQEIPDAPPPRAR